MHLRLTTCRSISLKTCAVVIAISVAPAILAQDKVKRIGEIEFFGSAGIDLNKLRAALPFAEGDEFSIEKATDQLGKAREAVKRVIGREPTDIEPTCCDSQGNWIIYVGLSGKAYHYNPQPKGPARLPKSVLNLTNVS